MKRKKLLGKGLPNTITMIIFIIFLPSTYPTPKAIPLGLTFSLIILHTQNIIRKTIILSIKRLLKLNLKTSNPNPKI